MNPAAQAAADDIIRQAMLDLQKHGWSYDDAKTSIMTITKYTESEIAKVGAADHA